jgi:hypothetical protein
MTKTQLIKTQIAELETLAQAHYEVAKMLLSNGDKAGFETFMRRTAEYDARIDAAEAELLAAVKEQLAELETVAVRLYEAGKWMHSKGDVTAAKELWARMERYDRAAAALEASHPRVLLAA